MNTTLDTARRSDRRELAERIQQRARVAPLVDVYENADELLLVADLPGAVKESVNVQLEKGRLTIEARRRDEAPGAHLLDAEHEPVDYYRVFAVPTGIDPAKIDAKLQAGVLRVRLPKADALRPRRIAVQTE